MKQASEDELSWVVALELLAEAEQVEDEFHRAETLAEALKSRLVVELEPFETEKEVGAWALVVSSAESAEA